MQEYKEYRPILERDDMTVVAEYKPSQDKSYLSLTEGQIERIFVDQLIAQGYEKVDFHSAQGLRDNLRRQLETLNNTRFSESEWETLLSLIKTADSTESDKIAAKSELIQRRDAKFDLLRDDGTIKNIMLLDKKNVHANRLQVMRQYTATEGAEKNRYDVTILVNGLPLVHVELKKASGQLLEAFNQIERYQNESFWSGDGFFEYVQIFVISTAAETRYYSNTTRVLAAEENSNPAQKGTRKRPSASFEFTSSWADAKNQPIRNLFDFARTFLSKNAILNILTKYCVFTAEKRLLVMRPYQIAATERVLQKINIAANNKLWKGKDGGGYVWHTTGSGKTLTSFKTAQLAASRDDIDKVLFVVDRKDLDYQTMREYDRFEKGAANGSRNTAILGRQLHDLDQKGIPHSYPIIVTTIQKLQTFVKKADKSDPVFQKRFVFIFDECHRSQFGGMRIKIDSAFKKRLIFGFTGTPIFEENSIRDSKGVKRTTADVFGERIHTYNIIDAINDGNVLKFHVEMNDAKEGTAGGGKREQAIVAKILEDFNTKTRRNYGEYKHNMTANVKELAKKPSAAVVLKERKYKGFNAIFAVESVPALMLYYPEFKNQLGDAFGTSFKIAAIFSYAPKPLSNKENPNEDNTGREPINYDQDGAEDAEALGTLEEENPDDAKGLPDDQKAFLKDAIDDYNKTFGTSYSIEGESFGEYYKDVSMRVKNREVDLLLVVNMFLTGFDAPALNTLWVDKNLRYHGMLQAFSRTNRILNSTKPQGEIVTFRNLKKEQDEMLALFGDKNAASVAILRPFEDYVNGYYDENKKEQVKGYYELVDEFKKNFKPSEELLGEKAKREFVKEFSKILQIRNVIETFKEFKPFSEESDRFDENEFLDYKERYLILYDEFRRRKPPKGPGGGIIVDGDIPDFELELVASLDVDVDYILELVRKRKHETESEREESLERIRRLVDSSVALRPKRDLFLSFAESVKPSEGDDDVQQEWRDFVRHEYACDLDALIFAENLKPEETRAYLDSVFAAANLGDSSEIAISSDGIQIDSLLPPTSRFKPNNEGISRVEIKRRVVEELRRFFEKYSGIRELDA